ncbi:hypothetical protein HHI36_015044, partial [Cryptolaemus montrouzieri]
MEKEFQMPFQKQTDKFIERRCSETGGEGWKEREKSRFPVKPRNTAHGVSFIESTPDGYRADGCQRTYTASIYRLAVKCTVAVEAAVGVTAWVLE